MAVPRRFGPCGAGSHCPVRGAFWEGALDQEDRVLAVIAEDVNNHRSLLGWWVQAAAFLHRPSTESRSQRRPSQPTRWRLLRWYPARP